MTFATRLTACGSLLLLAPLAAGAQTVRVGGTTTFRYVEVGSWIRDSIPAAQVPGDGLLRSAPDGTLVQCLTGDPVCRFIRSADAVSTVPMVQDLTVSAWGLGRGIRGYAQLRGRGVLAGADSVWPRESDHFDALVAFVELDRTRFRVRAGRQWSTSGLGFYNYDGGSALVRAGSGITIQAYGGRSLVRGLNEPISSDAVAAVESLAPSDHAWLLGSQISYRAAPGRSIALQYQREVRSDSSDLYSERLAADGLYRAGWGQVEASLKADLAARELNESLVRVRWDASPSLAVSAWGRTYKPFFELWTIWGAFSPVGFQEAGFTGAWRLLRRSARVEAQAAYRTYEDAGASTTFGEYRTDGWRVGLSGAYGIDPAWTVEGSYHADVGFGSAKSSASARLQRRLGEGTYVGLNASGFQTAYEFRVPEGTVWGLGADGAAPLGPRSRVYASAAWYKHRTGNGGSVPDWSQTRVTVRLDWTIGPEPGMSALPGRRP